jgi:hypothetical protein
LVIRHRRVDFERWHQGFLEHQPVRQAHGAINEVILRNALSPDEVWILIEWDDLYRAQLFARSEELQDQLDQSSIMLSPDIWFLEPLHETASPPPSSPAAGDQ